MQICLQNENLDLFMAIEVISHHKLYKYIIQWQLKSQKNWCLCLGVALVLKSSYDRLIAYKRELIRSKQVTNKGILYREKI